MPSPGFSPPPAAIPNALLASRLARGGGFEICEGLVDRPTRRTLALEAVSAAAGATIQDEPIDDGEEVRGGDPARRFASAPGGPAQDAFYRSPTLTRWLEERAGTGIAPTGSRGTYSYYVRGGDFLALHRDVDTCDLALITCLYDGPTGSGGQLVLYPGRFGERLSAVRRAPAKGAVSVHLRPGQTIVLLGGLVPHEVRPVAPGQKRIVSVLCYRTIERGCGVT